MTKSYGLTEKQTHIQDSSEYMRMLIGILLNDILKLRVDLSYCSRKNIAAIVKVSTKDEPVCLGYQDTDGGGNVITTFRRQLHAMIISLVERLNDANSVYSTSKGLKEKVFTEVVNPYLEMFKKVEPGIPPDVERALIASKKYDSLKDRLQAKIIGKKHEFTTSKETEQLKLSNVSNVNVKRGGGSDGSLVTPQQTEDNMIDKIVNYVVSEPYSIISDSDLTGYLNKVYLFSKKEGKTTEAETKQAIETAKEVAVIAPSAEAAMISSQMMADQSKAGTDEQEAAAKLQVTGEGGGKKGGRRLTRKRIFKLKKNRRITRIRPPFKSTAVAVAAFRRK